MMDGNSFIGRTFSLAKNFGRELWRRVPDSMADDAPGDLSGTLWLLRILHQLKAGQVNEHRVTSALLALNSVEPWLRYTALESLCVAFALRPDLITPTGMQVVIRLLADRTSWVRSAAFSAARTMYRLRREALTDRLLERNRQFLNAGDGQVCLFLLSCLPHAKVQDILEGNSLLKATGIDIAKISRTNQVFSELNLRGLTIGGQALVKLLVYSSLGKEAAPEQVKEEMADFVVPGIRATERLSCHLPTVGMEIHRAIKPADPADHLLATAQALLANYFSIIKTQHGLGESHMLWRRQGSQLEMRVMPAAYPVFKLIIDGFVEQGLLPDSKQHYYLSTVQGDLRKEIILLLVSTFFLDLPHSQGPQILRSFIAEGPDTLSFPGCYTYVGITLDPLSGAIAGSQSNIINKVLIFHTQIVDEAGEKLFTIPAYLYQTDVARKALLATGALAYLKPSERKSPLEHGLAGIYKGLRERLSSFYRLDLGLSQREADQLLGDGYRGKFRPPHGVDKNYVHSSVELLREKLLGRPQRLDELAQLLDEAAQALKARTFGPKLTTAVDLFYHGEMKAVVPTLIELLYSVEPAQRLEAARALGAAGGPQARLALEANLHSYDKALRLAVIEALATMGHPDSQPALNSQLEREEDSEVRARLEALLGHPAAQGQRLAQG